MAKSKLKDKLAARQIALNSDTFNKDQMGHQSETQQTKHIDHHITDKQKINRIKSSKNESAHLENQSYIHDLEIKQQEKYEDDMQKASARHINSTVAKEKNATKLKKIGTIILIILSVYMTFLIYGVITTEYVYNDNNEVVPKRVSVQQISDLNEFNTLATQYYACRSLYEEVLLLDCRYIAAQSQEELIIIGSEYWKKLDTVEDLIVQINALSVSSKYENIKTQMLTWTQTYISVYCQNMSYSISNNSEQDLNNALEYQKYTYNGFQIITQNLATMGTQVDGAEADVENMMSWSPSKYVQEQSGGIFE